MRYNINVIKQRIFVNGEECESVGEMDHYFRWVAKTPDGNIIKLDRTPKWNNEKYLYRQTWAEIQLWNTIAVRDRRYFPALLAHGTYGRNLSWLIEENLKIDPNFRAKRTHTQIVRMLQEKYGITDLYVCTGKTDNNWGATVRGRVVIWDFGCNSFNCNDY